MGARKHIAAEKMKEARKNLYFAKLKGVPSSPRKMRYVVDMIRGMEVNRALGVLRFSKKQAASILRYREKSGGFRNKEHFRRCYVVSEEAYTRLAPYLLFQKKSSGVNKPTHKLFPFNPDTASAATFEALGFSAKQAQVLLNYRKSLGGSFDTPERFARSYVVDSARFQTLKPYLRFE